MAETWLHIGSDTTEVAQNAPVVLRVGSATIAREHFRHDPPMPLEVEKGIAAVEDEIARVHRLVAGGSRLYTQDAVVREGEGWRSERDSNPRYGFKPV